MNSLNIRQIKKEEIPILEDFLRVKNLQND
jgi:hypothetical protein